MAALNGVRAGTIGLVLAITVSVAPGQAPSRKPGDNGPAVKAQINGPSAIALDPQGNIYVYEDEGGAIRRIDKSTKRITTVATECNPAWETPRPPGCFGPISHLRAESAKLIFSEFTYNLLSSFDIPSGQYSVVAGNGELKSGGDGGSATRAGLSVSYCFAVDREGDIFVCDSNYSIRRIDARTGVITTVAGSGKRGFSGDGGPALSAQFFIPLSLAVDEYGNLFVADDSSNRIRRIEAKTGIIRTIAGAGPVGPNYSVEFIGENWLATDARFTSPRSLVFDQTGNLLFLTAGRICRIDLRTGILSTIAGDGVDSYGGDGRLAKFAHIGPVDLAVDSDGNLFIAEFENNRIRRIDGKTGIISTVGGNGLPHRPPRATM